MDTSRMKNECGFNSVWTSKIQKDKLLQKSRRSWGQIRAKNVLSPLPCTTFLQEISVCGSIFHRWPQGLENPLQSHFLGKNRWRKNFPALFPPHWRVGTSECCGNKHAHVCGQQYKAAIALGSLWRLCISHTPFDSGLAKPNHFPYFPSQYRHKIFSYVGKDLWQEAMCSFPLPQGVVPQSC